MRALTVLCAALLLASCAAASPPPTPQPCPIRGSVPGTIVGYTTTDGNHVTEIELWKVYGNARAGKVGTLHEGDPVWFVVAVPDGGAYVMTKDCAKAGFLDSTFVQR